MVKGHHASILTRRSGFKSWSGYLYVINKRKGNPIGDGTRLEAGRARLIAALRVQLPPLPLTRQYALMVKGRSCLGPNEVFRVRILVGAIQ